MKLLVLFGIATAAAASTVTLQSSPDSPNLGQTVTFTATVLPANAGGAVTFFDGVNILGTRPLSNGQATLATSLLAAGGHSVLALYGAVKSTPVAVTVRSLPAFGLRQLQSSDTSPNNAAIIVADFNNDGIPDVAITTWEILGMIGVQRTELTVMLGNGDGTFRTTTQVSGNGIPAIVAADFNGDGNTDIVTFGGVYLGKGDGSFQPPVPLNIETSDAQQATLAVADFDGDGRADLAWSSPVNGQANGVVGIMLGNGDGTFQPSIQTAITAGGMIAVGDFNRDGRADIAVTNGANGASNSITVLLGKGDGTLQAAAIYPLNATPRIIVVADFNGDGGDDLAIGGNVLGTQTGMVSIALSNPDGTFQSPLDYPLPGLADLNAGDFNGDGRVDVVVEYGAATSPAGTNAYLMVGNGDGTLQGPSIQASGLTGRLAVSDFNRDGRPDLASVTNTASLETLLGQAAPQGAVTVTDVLSAASFQPPIESGSWVMIQGTNLANTTHLWQPSDFTGLGTGLPAVLEGVSVTIDGKPAFVEYISPTQINVQAPSDTAAGPVNVMVTNNGVSSAPATAELQGAAPAFFISPTYNVYASVIPGYIAVTASRPALPGELVVLWCTGFGPTIPPTPAGTIVTGAPATATTPVVTVGGIEVPVISSVMTPETVGLYQVTIQLPRNVPTGTPGIQASIDGVQSPSGVTLFVGPSGQ